MRVLARAAGASDLADTRASARSPAWPIRRPTSPRSAPAEWRPDRGDSCRDRAYRGLGRAARPYTEVVTRTLRNRSAALHDFLDMLSHRFVAFFARAGVKYRLNRSAETAATATPPQTRSGRRGVAGVHRLCDAASRRAARGRGRAAAALFRAVRRPPALRRAAGRAGLRLARPQGRGGAVRRRLALPRPRSADRARGGAQPGAWNRLGVDAAIGVRAWDPQARIILRIGPLDRAASSAAAGPPGLAAAGVAGARLSRLSRSGLPSIRCSPGPRCRRCVSTQRADPPPRLGWNTWIPAPEGPPAGTLRADADDALFEAERIEAEELAGRAAIERGRRELGRRLRHRPALSAGLLPPPVAAPSQPRLPARRRRPHRDDPDAPLSYLELGSAGFECWCSAACTSAWQLIGIDNPAVIAGARVFLADAGIANAEFIEADLRISPTTPPPRFVTLNRWSCSGWRNDRRKPGIGAGWFGKLVVRSSASAAV